ncbi:glycosyltransferase, partial [Terribacillus saccharophilus]|uniref:glycosyltransferase n=1 Tax=Terribacillus saccharophilus TaxID=361277 RepID=UPI000BD656B5
ADNEVFFNWLKRNKLESNKYFLIVGRLVPENNYKYIIDEYKKTKTEKPLVIITNTKDKYYNKLKDQTKFNEDPRILFVGTVYDQDLLASIRTNAFSYIHGHEVGGTNPSLLEALGATSLNLLLDVNFNKEVAEDAAIYFSKQENNLSHTIKEIEVLDEERIQNLSRMAKDRILNHYSWSSVIGDYEELFIEGTIK